MLTIRKPDHKLAWHPMARGVRLGLIVASLATLGVSSHAATSPNDELGTLFYSPAERIAITRARVEGAESGPQSNQMVVSGVVKRQHAKSTAWINGKAVNDGKSVQSIRRVRITDKGVTLDGNPVRVGEKLELTTGQRSDIVEPGAVSMTRRK